MRRSRSTDAQLFLARGNETLADLAIGLARPGDIGLRLTSGDVTDSLLISGDPAGGTTVVVLSSGRPVAEVLPALEQALSR